VVLTWDVCRPFGVPWLVLGNVTDVKAEMDLE
jgi:hypothetical protein